MKKTNILLSTYNGEHYIKEQLVSILTQTYTNILITIRDDGSTDNTVSIIQQFITEYPNKIKLIIGTNIGVQASFLTLINNADSTCSYFAFCDQDDIWLSDKIEKSVNILNDLESLPAMTCSCTSLVNKNLEMKKNWPPSPKKPLHFFNAIVENIAVGTTLTFNYPALEIIKNRNSDPSQIIMHDWWVYLIISAFGKVVFIEEPTVLYRQHENNVVGAETSHLERFKRKYHSFLKHRNKRIIYHQAKHFHDLFKNELNHELLKELQLFLTDRHTLLERAQYVTKTPFYRQSKIDNLLLKFLLLINHT